MPIYLVICRCSPRPPEPDAQVRILPRAPRYFGPEQGRCDSMMSGGVTASDRQTPRFTSKIGEGAGRTPPPPSRTILCLSPNEFMKSRSQALDLGRISGGSRRKRPCVERCLGDIRLSADFGVGSHRPRARSEWRCGALARRTSPEVCVWCGRQRRAFLRIRSPERSPNLIAESGSWRGAERIWLSWRRRRGPRAGSTGSGVRRLGCRRSRYHRTLVPPRYRSCPVRSRTQYPRQLRRRAR